MEEKAEYNFTLRFDDDEHSLTAKNGISIAKISELLQALAKAVPLQKDEKLVLSEVRGNCYALNLYSESETVQSRLEVVHKNISKNSYLGLNQSERNYAQTLGKVLGNKYKLEVYDSSKSYNIHIDKIVIPNKDSFYYNISTVQGIITSIGGRSLKSKSSIRVSGVVFDIELNSKQEIELSKYFKSRVIRFSINKKINIHTNDVKSAELLDYKVLNDTNLSTILEDFREKYSDEIIEQYKDKYFTE